jgi:Lipocalin-like domain
MKNPMNNPMNRIFGCLAAVALALALLPTAAVSQKETLKEQLVGAWTLVSIIATDKAGNKSDRRGPNPKGLLIFDASGRYSILTSRAELPNFKVDNVNQGTPEENKAVMTGMIANVGTWSVDEATKTITTHVEAGSFPNLNGNTQTRVISALTADELRYTNGASVSGTVDEATWRRAK